LGWLKFASMSVLANNSYTLKGRLPIKVPTD